MILDVNGTSGVATIDVALRHPISSENAVRLRHFHLPDLPLLDAFTAALTVNSKVFNIPIVSSIEELVDILDDMDDSGTRVCYVWYNSHEFEICAGTQTITLSNEFAALLKLPTTLVAGTCYSSSLYESNISIYSHYAVAIAGVRGMWNGSDYDEVVAKVRRDGDISGAYFHYLRGAEMALGIRILTVKRDGTVGQYTSPEIWSIGLEVQ